MLKWIKERLTPSPDPTMSDFINAIGRASKLNLEMQEELAATRALNSSLQEEVFLLRDELAAVTQHFGIELVNDLKDGVSIIITADKQQERAQAERELESVMSDQYIAAKARALVVAFESALQRKFNTHPKEVRNY